MTKRVKKKSTPKAKAPLIKRGRVAVVGLDPGGTTGVFGAICELRPTMKLTAESIDQDLLMVEQVEGSFVEQSYLIMEKIERFFALANIGYVSLSDCHVAMEDFVLRRRGSGDGATGNLTSCWVAAGIHVLLSPAGANPERVEYAQASQAKGYATDQRLKSWGLYDLTKGTRHARDASRHWALKVNQLIDK